MSRWIRLRHETADVVVERCSFRGVYDVCFTMQGFPKKGWRDVHCRACTMTDCTQAFEIWCLRAHPCKNPNYLAYDGNWCQPGGRIGFVKYDS